MERRAVSLLQTILLSFRPMTPNAEQRQNVWTEGSEKGQYLYPYGVWTVDTPTPIFSKFDVELWTF